MSCLTVSLVNPCGCNCKIKVINSMILNTHKLIPLVKSLSINGCLWWKCAHIHVYAGMADFQHVVPVHAAETRKRKHPECPNNKEHLCNGSLPSDPVLSHAMPDSNIS